MDTERATVRIDGAGPRPLVIKQARGGSAPTRLRAEAEALRRAQHPGVVGLVDVTDTGDEVVIRTRYCGSRTLASAGTITVKRAAGLIAAVATTVADLHDLGIRHGRLTPDHVLIAADGRPVLCGFADAALLDQADPGTADDVLAVGTMLQHLLEPLGDVAPIPATRFGRRGAWSGHQRRALLNLADQATADEPALRPTARQLAENIRATVPDATLFDETSYGEHRDEAREAPHPDPHDRTARMLTLGGAGAAALIIVVAVSAALLPSAESASSPSPHPRSTGAGAVDDSLAPTAVPDRFPGAIIVEPDPPSGYSGGAPVPMPDLPQPRLDARGCSVMSGSARPAATSDGQQCAATLQVVDGVLSIGGEQFRLDVEEVSVAIGDFQCTGSAQAAVLDLSAGHVYVFWDWADADAPAMATAITLVPEARRLLAEPAAVDECHRLVVLDQFGIRHPVTLASEEQHQ
jgi:hypothetical protein